MGVLAAAMASPLGVEEAVGIPQPSMTIRTAFCCTFAMMEEGWILGKIVEVR